jgi:hypothetical protein
MKTQYVLLTAALMMPSALRAAEPLVVHEWGTFTALQDEQGKALGRINTDDEPVPAFVHTMPQTELFPATTAYDDSGGKGVPAGDPNITMRLETPVLYFHPPKDQRGPVTLDVHVAFRGGWLTQYFPDGNASVRGVPAAVTTRPAISADTVGELSWKGLVVNAAHGEMPLTSDPVWTSPRAVDAVDVSAGTERERFLFYRGVGHLDSPLSVDRKGGTLEAHLATGAAGVDCLWHVDVRADGMMAFSTASVKDGACKMPAEFSPGDYDRTAAPLKRSLHEALVKQGLFPDEADALLNTWEQSYFKNPGERVFFMVPQKWTDNMLPLNLSVPAEVTRVMVGRVELVTPAERAVVEKLMKVPEADAKQLKAVTQAMTRLQNDPAKAAAYDALAGGRGRLEDLGVPVPEAYAEYLSLGRFRTPLLMSGQDAMGSPLAQALVP